MVFEKERESTVTRNPVANTNNSVTRTNKTSPIDLNLLLSKTPLFQELHKSHKFFVPQNVRVMEFQLFVSLEVFDDVYIYLGPSQQASFGLAHNERTYTYLTLCGMRFPIVPVIINNIFLPFFRVYVVARKD